MLMIIICICLLKVTRATQALNIALTSALTCVDVPLVNAGEEKKWQ